MLDAGKSILHAFYMRARRKCYDVTHRHKDKYLFSSLINIYYFHQNEISQAHQQWLALLLAAAVATAVCWFFSISLPPVALLISMAVTGKK